ncbi:TetR/AcrR family transcriptional regulator [Providencia rettgeri]|uniref:TetR/AcrR family transcriptional regulator n=1 Tax=Providencia rettgeri TaxID=587 RepID=UPI0032D9FF21
MKQQLSKKAQIIEVASILIRENGYHAVSIQDIAEKVGIKKSSIYSHFKDKDSIVEEVINVNIGLFNQISYTGDELEDSIRYLTDISLCLQTHIKCLGLQLLYSSSELKNVSRFFCILKDNLIKLMQQNDKYSHNELVILSEDIISQIEGATIWLIIEKNESPLKRAIDRFIKQLSNLPIKNVNIK